MRSTGYVFISLVLHALCVFALTLTPMNTLTPEKADTSIEVKMGEPAETPGTAQSDALPASMPAPAAVVEKAPAPAPAKTIAKVQPQPVPIAKEEPKPAPKPVPVPVKVAAAKPARKTVRAVPVIVDQTNSIDDPKVEDAAVVAEEAPAPAPAPVVEKPKKETPKVVPAAAVAKGTPVPAPKEKLIPVKESAPAGVEAADAETEAKSEDQQRTADPTPVVAGAAGGELPKGGASKEVAVSYLDLRQMNGNKTPVYPMQARLEKRQGQLELVYRVSKDGKVSDVQVSKSSGYKDLDSEAVRAISQFRYVPGQEGWARHPVSFNLKGEIVTLPSRLRGKGAQAD